MHQLDKPRLHHASTPQQQLLTHHPRPHFSLLLRAALYGMGVPAFFMYLLHLYKVPELARVKMDNVYLRLTVHHAHVLGIYQPEARAGRVRWC